MKPILNDDLFCYIRLKKSQIDYGKLRSKAKREGFREQIDRHITIIGGATQDRVLKILSKRKPEERKKIVKEIGSIAKNPDWKYVQGDVYEIERRKYLKRYKVWEHRESYIRIIEMPAMGLFYRNLNTLLHTHIPTQFPHITLFTKGEGPGFKFYGIPIVSRAEFKQFHPKKAQ